MPADSMTVPTHRPRAVVFDWDNTLVDTWPVIHAALEATFIAMGQEPWTYDQTRQRVAKSLRETFPGLFGDRWEEAGEVFYDTFGSLHLEKLEPLDNALETLQTLAGSGLPCSIVSNKKGDFLRKEVEHLGWGNLIHCSVGALDAERDKPHPAPMDMALAGTGLAPSKDIWYVGDTLVDIEFAEATGCTGILVHTAESQPDAKAKADFTASDLADFIGIFNRLPPK